MNSVKSEKFIISDINFPYDVEEFFKENPNGSFLDFIEFKNLEKVGGGQNKEEPVLRDDDTLNENSPIAYFDEKEFIRAVKKFKKYERETKAFTKTFVEGFPELLRIIVFFIPTFKGLGNALVSAKCFSKSLLPGDPEKLKNKFLEVVENQNCESEFFSVIKGTDILHGKCVSYSKYGMDEYGVCVDGNYYKGKKHGKWVGQYTFPFNFEGSETTKYIKHFVHGEIVGCITKFYPYGVLKSKKYFKKGVKHGKYIRFDDEELEILREKYVTVYKKGRIIKTKIIRGGNVVSSEKFDDVLYRLKWDLLRGESHHDQKCIVSKIKFLILSKEFAGKLFSYGCCCHGISLCDEKFCKNPLTIRSLENIIISMRMDALTFVKEENLDDTEKFINLIFDSVSKHKIKCELVEECKDVSCFCEEFEDKNGRKHHRSPCKKLDDAIEDCPSSFVDELTALYYSLNLKG